MDRGLPKGVYKTKSGKYSAKVWPEENKVVRLGTFNTVEEAEYVRGVATKDHHWLGVKPDENKYGFIYKVVNKRTKQIYFGRRVYKYYNQNTGSRDIHGDWEFYSTGSSVVVDMFHKEPWNLEFTILCNTDSNDESSYLEWLLIKHYLLKVLPTGEPMCVNRMLPKLFSRGLKEVIGKCEGICKALREELP